MSRRGGRGPRIRGNYRGVGGHGNTRHFGSVPPFFQNKEDGPPPNALLPTPQRSVTGGENYAPRSFIENSGDKSIFNNFKQRLHLDQYRHPPYHSPTPNIPPAYRPINDWHLQSSDLHRPPYLQSLHGQPPTPSPPSDFPSKYPKSQQQPREPLRAMSPNVQPYHSQQLEGTGGSQISDHQLQAPREVSLRKLKGNNLEKDLVGRDKDSEVPDHIRLRLQEKLEVEQRIVSDQTRMLTQSKQRGKGEHRRREHERRGDKQTRISRARTSNDSRSASPGVSSLSRGRALNSVDPERRPQSTGRQDNFHHYGAIGEVQSKGRGRSGSVPDAEQFPMQGKPGGFQESFKETNVERRSKSKDIFVLEDKKADSFFPDLPNSEGCLLEVNESVSVSNCLNSFNDTHRDKAENNRWDESRQSNIQRSNSLVFGTNPHPWDHLQNDGMEQSPEFWVHMPGPLKLNLKTLPKFPTIVEDSNDREEYGINAFHKDNQSQAVSEDQKLAIFQLDSSGEESNDEYCENEDVVEVARPGELNPSKYGGKHNLSQIYRSIEAIEKFQQRVGDQISSVVDKTEVDIEVSGESIEHEESNKAKFMKELNQLYQNLNIPAQSSFSKACENLLDFKNQVKVVKEELNYSKDLVSKSIDQNVFKLKGLCSELDTCKTNQDYILFKAETTLKAIDKEFKDSGVSLDQIKKLDESQAEMKTMLKTSMGAAMPHIYPFDNEVFQDFFVDNRKRTYDGESLSEDLMIVAKQLHKLTLDNDQLQSDQETNRHSSSGLVRRASCPSLQSAKFPGLFLSPSIAHVNTNVSNALIQDKLKSVDKEEFVKKSTKCSLCKKTYCFPHVLHCNHVFCFSCIARLVKKCVKKNGEYRTKCPTCGTNSKLDEPDPNLFLIDLPKCMHMCRMKISPFSCTLCSNHDEAVAYCSTCFNYLCPLCVDAHTDNKSLAFHSVTDQLKICCFEGEIFNMCSSHREIIRQFCQTCREAVCDICVDSCHQDHQVFRDNEWDCIQWIDTVKSSLSRESNSLKANAEELRGIMQKNKMMKQNIENAHRLYLRKVDDFCNAVEEMRIEVSSNIDRTLMKIQANAHDYLNAIEKELTCKERRLIAFMDYINNLKKSGSMSFVIKSLPKLQACYIDLVHFSESIIKFKHACLTISYCPSYPEVNEFFQEIFNCINIKTNVDIDFKKNPFLKERLEDIDNSTNIQSGLELSLTLGQRQPQEPLNQGHLNKTCNNSELFDYPRVTFTYKDMFGKYGRGKCEFAEPSGIEYLIDGGLAVCDTKNHRICIFDETFKFVMFIGQPNNLPPLVEARDISDRQQDNFERTPGKLYFPYRISQCPRTTNLVVVERQPSLCIQIFSLTGEYIRSFGHDTLRSPRGICVDEHGVIIVVEGRTMKVVRFSPQGKKLFYAHASLYLEFPNDIAARDGLIYISDNRAHCVHVFDYSMEKISTIGNESVTYYPIGVTINSYGLVIVTDNHNTFNVSVFNKDGRYLYGFRSRAKYANCFNVTVHRSKLHLAVTTRDSQILCFDYARRPDQPTPAAIEDFSVAPQYHEV